MTQLLALFNDDTATAHVYSVLRCACKTEQLIEVANEKSYDIWFSGPDSKRKPLEKEVLYQWCPPKGEVGCLGVYPN
jgi:hypothetical protein